MGVKGFKPKCEKSGISIIKKVRIVKLCKNTPPINFRKFSSTLFMQNLNKFQMKVTQQSPFSGPHISEITH